MVFETGTFLSTSFGKISFKFTFSEMAVVPKIFFFFKQKTAYEIVM